MANWKKVVVSGSSAELAGLTVDATITGDISGVAGSVLAANVTGAGSAITADASDFLASSVTTISSAQATKLSNIETAADVTDTTNVVAALTAGTNVAIAANGTISSTDTNTQLSTGDVRGKLSGAGSVSYNTSTGVITGTDTNTQLSDAEVIAMLTAGDNVAISEEGVISSTDTNTNTQLSDAQVRSKFTGGTNVSITAGGEISSTDTNTQLSTADVRGKFSAGTNVTITDGVIASSFTDTNTQRTDSDIRNVTAAQLTAGDNVTLVTEGESIIVSSTDTNTNTQLSDAQVRAKFTGGTNVSITAGGVISSTDTDTQLSTADVRGKFSAGTNVTITDGVIASSFTDTNTQLSDAEVIAMLTAGDNVGITEEGVISSTDTNTQLSTADVRGKFSAGTNVTITDGVIASSFTNTNDDVSVANLKTRLASGFGSNAVQIGDANDIVTIGNKLVVAGDLVVNGATTTVNTANLNIEDSFILLASGSAERVDAGIIFNNQAAGTGDSFFYDSQSGRPSWAESVAFNATAVAPSAYIPRVYDVDAEMAPVAERGSIKVEGQDIFMYS